MNSLEDIIFSHRNKAYGAFYLRSRQFRVLLVSTLLSCLFFAVAFLGILFYYSLQEELVLDDWIIYDEAVMTNPYQTDFLMEKPKSGSPQDQKDAVTDLTKEPGDEDFDLGVISNIKGDTNGLGNDSTVSDGTGISDTSRQGAFNVSKDPSDVYNLLSSIDVLPMFPGGETARMKYFHEQIKYPKFALDNKIQGVVYVNFIVERDSSISNIKILQGIGAGCDEEAVKAVKGMPKWIPGVKDDQAIRVQITMPLTFSLMSRN